MNIFFFKFLSGLLAVFFLLAPAAAANVINEGNNEVRIVIRKKDNFTQRTSLYPGQSIALPNNAAEVRIAPTFGARGDEEIKVKIIETNGTTKTLTRYGASYEIGSLLEGEEETDKEESVLKPGLAVNNGNITVTIRIFKKNGETETKSLYVGQPAALPVDTEEVRVLRDVYLRGDEIIKVNLTFPNGDTATVNRLGGRAKLLEEEF